MTELADFVVVAARTFTIAVPAADATARAELLDACGARGLAAVHLQLHPSSAAALFEDKG